MKHVLILAPFVVAFVACDGCGGESNDGDANNGGSTSDDWREPTKSPPEGCQGCPEVELGELGGHGAEVTFLQDPEVDDELVQWSTCLHSYMDCVDAGGDSDGCMSDAPCPGKCKDAYAERVAGTEDYPTRADAIEAVFFEEGGVCVVDTVPLAVGEEVEP